MALNLLRVLWLRDEMAYNLPDEFGLGSAEHYVYTSQSSCTSIEGVDDVKEYQDVMVIHASVYIARHRCHDPILTYWN